MEIQTDKKSISMMYIFQYTEKYVVWYCEIKPHTSPRIASFVYYEM